MSEEEWRAKYEAMKASVPMFKKMKKELGDIEVCVGVGVCVWGGVGHCRLGDVLSLPLGSLHVPITIHHALCLGL